VAHQKFIDKCKEASLDHGIEYFAVGLIVSCNMENGVPNRSGKDYCVEYIDPFGHHQMAWRASDEIEISPIDEDDHMFLNHCYEVAQAE
jgi:hypothetical protein